MREPSPSSSFLSLQLVADKQPFAVSVLIVPSSLFSSIIFGRYGLIQLSSVAWLLQGEPSSAAPNADLFSCQNYNIFDISFRRVTFSVD